MLLIKYYLVFHADYQMNGIEDIRWIDALERERGARLRSLAGAKYSIARTSLSREFTIRNKIQKLPATSCTRVLANMEVSVRLSGSLSASKTWDRNQI